MMIGQKNIQSSGGHIREGTEVEGLHSLLALHCLHERAIIVIVIMIGTVRILP